ncbi:hypothetical protein GKA01_09080 [Gluconobacter kanchanaburiensis NBRC 103587]|uniref:Uncharacterized protein n=1 Tax=Gluconobacter kanchanaburiensis NBRC 103587 TaxID=1307948 RepID=A0A511B7Q1_9PROT|nr:hypothetical protein AA103587_0641 [Gluconobacter kanchanaburiensis NBRC 103587]GEK95711.1 hypothetical protein GKA01_09080 [Gluconobacter kanchanaburiensis NBRC 103587]
MEKGVDEKDDVLTVRIVCRSEESIRTCTEEARCERGGSGCAGCYQDKAAFHTVWREAQMSGREAASEQLPRINFR